MSLKSSVRALPALLRIGFAEAVAYRAEMLVWILATTMPLVMLALFAAVAREAPIGRFGQPQLIAYFLSTFIVRQLTGAWVAWEMNYEIREGTLAMRLLRPVHPLLCYATENVASIPMRAVVSLPVAIVALFVIEHDQVSHDPAIWAIWGAAMLGAWLITLGVNFVFGSLAFFMESSLKIADVWAVLFFVFSGYLIPVDLFPPAFRHALDWLPFRYQLGLPVELMTGAHDRTGAIELLLGQWAWVAIVYTLVVVTWKRGVRRFAAYGG